MPLTHHTYLKSPTARWLLATLLLVLILIFLWHHHVTSTKEMSRIRKANANRQAPVVVKSAYTRDVPVYLTGLGSVTPTYNVTVKTQIDGQLLKVYFKEGQMVKMGELLALIDPRPYEAQLIQFQGQLERDQALLANAGIDLTRYRRRTAYWIGISAGLCYPSRIGQTG